MIQKIKDALNSSITWVIAAAAAILYFWKKEKDLEYELAESKADSQIKTDQEKVNEADAAGAVAVDRYKAMYERFESTANVPVSPASVRPSGDGAAGADNNAGSGTQPVQDNDKGTS